MSSYQLIVGIAHSGWKKYDVGELSMMIVVLSSQLILLKSFT